MSGIGYDDRKKVKMYKNLLKHGLRDGVVEAVLAVAKL